MKKNLSFKSPRLMEYRVIVLIMFVLFSCMDDSELEIEDIEPGTSQIDIDGGSYPAIPLNVCLEIRGNEGISFWFGEDSYQYTIYGEAVGDTTRSEINGIITNDFMNFIDIEFSFLFDDGTGYSNSPKSETLVESFTITQIDRTNSVASGIYEASGLAFFEDSRQKLISRTIDAKLVFNNIPVDILPPWETCFD